MNINYGNNRPIGGGPSLNIMRNNQQIEQIRRMQIEQQRRMVRDVHRPHMG